VLMVVLVRVDRERRIFEIEYAACRPPPSHC
jgi:hypothetical protein